MAGRSCGSRSLPAYLSIARAEQRAELARGRCGTTHWRGSSEQPSRAPAPPSASCLRARTPAHSCLGPGPTLPPPAPQPRNPAVPEPRSPAAPRPRGRRPRSKLAGASGLGGSPPPHLFELVAVGSARLRLAFGKVTRRREAQRVGEGDRELARALFMLPGSLGSGCSGAAGSAFPFPGARRQQSLYATQPRRVLCQVCTAGEARSARRQMLLPPRRRRLPAPELYNCHTAPELNLNRE